MNNKKKILIVQSNMEIGGAQKSLVTLLNSIDYSKYEIDLCLLQNGVLLSKIPSDVNILYLNNKDTLYFTPLKKLIKNKKQFKYFDIYFLKLIAYLNYKIYKNKKYSEQCLWEIFGSKISCLNNRYDIAIAYCQGFPTYYVATKVIADKKITWMHNDICKQIHDLNYTKEIYHNFAIINCVSSEAKKNLTQIYPEFINKIRVFYNLVDVKDIRNLAQERISLDTKFLSRKNMITTVGRLVDQKGYDLAIKVAKLLNEKNVDFLWIFVGDGNEKENLLSEIKKYHLENNVLLVGNQINPYPFIEKCDIYVQPSKWEGYCITLTEAKALCKPIVTTDFSGAKEQIINMKTGIIVKPDEKQLYDAIFKLINNKYLMNNFKNNLLKEDANMGNDLSFEMMIQSIEEANL